MQFGPDACTRTPRQQAHRFAAVAESQHEQPRPAILATLRFAHHRTTAVVDLRFFSHWGQDDACRFWKPGASKLANEALHRLIAARKTVVGHQVLPDSLAIASAGEVLLDQLPVHFTDTCRWRRRVTRSALFFCKRAYKVGGHHGRLCRRSPSPPRQAHHYSG